MTLQKLSKSIRTSQCQCVSVTYSSDAVHSVGDITPVEGVPSHVKHRLEEQAMDTFLNEMLGGKGNKDARERFRSLWDVSS